MPDEPLPLELRLGLRAGSVYYFQSRELSSSEPHFFVTVNREPASAKVLLLTIVTSKVNKVRLRNRERPETVVEITPADYADLSMPSAIDCNVVLEKPLSELVGLVQRKEVRYHRDLPPQIFARIRAAILASPVVEDSFKQML